MRPCWAFTVEIGYRSRRGFARRGFCSERQGSKQVLVQLRNASVRPFRAPGSSLFFEGRRLNRGESDVEEKRAHQEVKDLLPNTNWTIRQGEAWLVVGPNGSGKSCLAQSLCGRAMVVKGQVRFPNPEQCNEKSIAYLSLKSDQALAALVRKVAESKVGWNRLTEKDLFVRNLLQDACSSSSSSPAWLEPLGLGALLDEHLSNLSTGQLRKVTIAQALMRNPRVCILDEPFDSLDAQSVRQTASFLDSLARNRLNPVQLVIISHRASEVALLPFITHVLEIGGDNRVATIGPADKTDVLDTVTTPPIYSKNDCTAVADELARRFSRLVPRDCNDDQPLVRMRNVCVSFGSKRVLHGVDWEVFPGQHCVVHGRNGAGKSVLLGMITGETNQTYSNDVSLFGRPRSSMSLDQVRARVASISPQMQTVFQQSHQSALKTICTGFHGIVGANCPPCSEGEVQLATQWARVLGVAHLLDQSFTALSQGQQRLILFIRTLVSGQRGRNPKELSLPPLLLLDELFHGLDAKKRRLVLDVLEVVKDLTTVVIVTHHEDEVPAFCKQKLQL